MENDVVAKYQAILTKELEKWPMVEVGSYISQRKEKNSLLAGPIRGVTAEGFIDPRQQDADTSLYNVFHKEDFVFNPARMEINSIYLNTELEIGICSSLYEIFYVKKPEVILPKFLFLYLKRKEFSRFCCFDALGSARNYFRFSNLKRVKIPLPPIEVQRAYVKAYQGLTTLIEQNEALVKELEKTAQACIVECREKWPMVEIGKYLQETSDTNEQLNFSIDEVRGISIEKKLIETKADMTGVSLKPYKVVAPEEFAFVSVTSRNGEKISLAINTEGASRIVSSSYVTFKSDDLYLLPEYLFLQFKRPEFDRYARFNSWGSARETFTWEDMCRVKIPLPPIEVQRAIVALYTCAEEARKIAAEARELLKKACPAMVQSAAHHKVGVFQ